MISYFLGANSSKGFHSLYDELIDRTDAKAVYILKGGPGCGKSTLMKKVGYVAAQAGQPVEYIRCSGDPDSLDAILLPNQKTAIVDGTAPHVVEPKLPGAVDHYINLGECYDPAPLWEQREELSAILAKHKACYDRAYRSLAAAADIRNNNYHCLATSFRQEKLSKRLQGIIARELHKKGTESGRITHRFLSALSCQGQICQWETVEQYRKVYVLEDSFGFSHHCLPPLAAAAQAAGYDVTLCLSPLQPAQPEHLLIPGLSLAFVTSSPTLPYPGKAYRRIHLDTLLDSDELRSLRPRLRFSSKISEALIQDAIGTLEEAKILHDKLEEIYHPHVDFTHVNAIAEKLISRLALV